MLISIVSRHMPGEMSQKGGTKGVTNMSQKLSTKVSQKLSILDFERLFHGEVGGGADGRTDKE